jgi:glycosyltransferase involved in cell wall biosynthesis
MYMEKETKNKYPKISVVMPTLNAEKFLDECLSLIRQQDYPQELVEIVIADANSADGTREIAKKHNSVIIDNPLITSEGGKAAGVKAATGEYIALLDSDNFLIDKNWFKNMIEPLEVHPEVLGSEPWEYTWRKEDGFITRYCALIGMNDPTCHFIGNYDRMNLLTNTWTGIGHEEEDKGDYLIATFDKRGVPTIGANGTIFRTNVLERGIKEGYLFDIDVLATKLKEEGSLKFIKVKIGIVHSYCESDITKFAKKQKRRIMDHQFNKAANRRDYGWVENNKKGLIKFVLATTLVFPLIYESLKGYSRKKDLAWFFHPLACWITLWEYGWGTIFSYFKRTEASREGWKQ